MNINDYIININNNSTNELFSTKSNPKYKMGWKITCNDKSNNKILINNDKYYTNNINLNFDNKFKSKIKSKTKYNIYDKFPEYFPEIHEQGNMDTCVPTCISTLYYYNTFKQKNNIKFQISRLFLYYHVRKIYDELSDDNGSRIIDCLKILKNKGVPPEFTHQYHEKFLYQEPSQLSNKLSKYCKLLGFAEIDRSDIKKNLLLDYPVLCGIKIFNNFNNGDTIRTGYVKPISDDNDLIGGHSIIIVGYDDNKQNYIFLNSWGKTWGDNGFGYIPYNYINNYDYADEFFILTQVTDPIINFFDTTQLVNVNVNVNVNNNKINCINQNNSLQLVQLIKILLLSTLIIAYST